MNISANKLPAFTKKIFLIGFAIFLFITIIFGTVYYTKYGFEIPNVRISSGSDNLNTEPQAEDTGIVEQDFEGITNNENEITSGTNEINALNEFKSQKDPKDRTTNFNILVLGIDRRYASQTNWRTDVIQLVTLSSDRKNAVITHIPRDVWAGNYKINAVYNLQGPDAIKDEINKLTGQRPDRIIRVDFDAFVYAVDAVGGVTINNPVEFTDNDYPNDREGSNETMSVTFPKGEQTMDGEEALIYVRSRKGNNGEGSDYARGTRQQIVMKSILSDYFKPNNLFNPKTPEVLYKIASEKIYTDINLSDTQTLFELLIGHKDINIKQLRLDTTNYLTVPSNRSAYGGAWTLIPKSDYTEIHKAILTLLKGEDLQNPNVSGILPDTPIEQID